MYKTSGILLIMLVTNCSISTGHGLEYPLPLKPDPTRFWTEIKAFQDADFLDKPPVGGIVCTGSSSMRMWHPRIQKDLPGLTIVPRGFGGSHYTDVIYYVEELVLKYQPRALLIYEGDNDAAYGKTPNQIFHDFEFLVQHIRQNLPELRFYVIGSKPSLSRWDIAEEMQAANALIKAYCREDLKCTYIDVWPNILGADEKPRDELFMEDKLHLNSVGYDQWAKTIAPVLHNVELNFE